MKKKPAFHIFVSIFLGFVFGSYILYRTEDYWFGVVFTILSTIIVFGLSKHPKVISPKQSENNIWYLLLSVLMVVVMVTPSLGSIIRTSNVYITMVFLGGILISGVIIGVEIGSDTL